MDGLKGGILQGPPSCSVCLEVVNDASERSIAKLTCGHQFHLDCIGSAFNAKGSMQCPNCRRIEHGQWLYANGGRQREDPFFEDIIIEEEYDLFAGAPEFLFPHEYLVGHVQWCPYQGSYAQLSLSIGGDAGHHLSAHPELVVNVVVGENVESSDTFHPCPLVIAQTPTLVARVPSPEENVRIQGSGAHPHQGARLQRQFPSTRGGQWGGGYQQPSVASSPIGLAGGVGPPEGSSWPYLENRSAVHAPTPQARYHGRWRPHSFIPSVDNHHHPASQFPSVSWDYAGQSAVQTANREAEARLDATFSQRRQERVSAFRQYPAEREGQRWAPPPLSGLYGAHGILGSELPTQAGFGAPALQNSSEIQAGFRPFQPYPIVEDIDGQSASSMYLPR